MADETKRVPDAQPVGRDPRMREEPVDEGGDAACWAHLVCPECGNVVSEGHRPGCNYTGDS